MPRQTRGESVCHSELVPMAALGVKSIGQALLIECAAEACAQCVAAFDTKCVDELMVASARLYAECVPRRVLQRRLRTWQVDVFAGRHRLRWRCLERGVMTL